MGIMHVVLMTFMAAASRPEARIVGYGIIGGIPGGVEKTEQVNMGEKLKMGDIKVKETSTSAPGRRGSSFGISYTFHSNLPEKHQLIEEVIVFPKELTDPKTGKSFKSNIEKVYLKNGMTRIFAYTIEEAWENVPGTWHFMVKCDGQVIAEKSITVR